MKNIIFTPGPSYVQVPAQAICYQMEDGTPVIDCITDDNYQLPAGCVRHYEAKWDGESPYVEVLEGVDYHRVHAFAGWPSIDKEWYEAELARIQAEAEAEDKVREVRK